MLETPVQDQAGPRAVLSKATPSVKPQCLLLGAGETVAAARLEPLSLPVPPPLESVFWLELCEAEDNLGLISVPGRHVTCVAEFKQQES